MATNKYSELTKAGREQIENKRKARKEAIHQKKMKRLKNKKEK